MKLTMTMLALAALLGCATTNTQQPLSDAQASIRAAEEMNAEETPDAAYHLELANEQLGEAQQAMEEGDDERAARLLERADADAELAIALARAAEVRSDAESTQERIDELQEQYL